MESYYFSMVYYNPGYYQYCEICGEKLRGSCIKSIQGKKKGSLTKRLDVKQCPRCFVMYTENPVGKKSGILRIHVPESISKEDASSICQEAWQEFHGQLCPNIYRSDIMKLIYLKRK